jgi:hypothetical protein
VKALSSVRGEAVSVAEQRQAANKDLGSSRARNTPSTLQKATSFGVRVLVPTITVQRRSSAIVQLPGGYIAEIHSTALSTKH